MVSFSLTLTLPLFAYISPIFFFFLVSLSFRPLIFLLFCLVWFVAATRLRSFLDANGQHETNNPVRVYLVPIETSNDAMIVSHWCDDSFFFFPPPRPHLNLFVHSSFDCLLAIESQKEMYKMTYNKLCNANERLLFKGQMEVHLLHLIFRSLFYHRWEYSRLF